jgi:ribosomal subunit interface protein
MLRVSGRNLDIGAALRDQAQERIASAAERYAGGLFEGHVTVGKEGTGFRTECALRLKSGTTLHATGYSHDAYSSVGMAADRIESRLKRFSQRRRRHADTGADPVQSAPYRILDMPAEPAPDHEEPTEHNPVVVAETTVALQVFSVSQAVQELDLTGAPFLLFRHGGSQRINVVYRRGDGHIGWIDPQSTE